MAASEDPEEASEQQLAPVVAERENGEGDRDSSSAPASSWE